MKQTARLGFELARRYLTSHGRPLPNFLIIGAQKAGTSSLFEYLIQHPDVRGSFVKEVQYFTRRHWLGERGYRSFFPMVEEAGLAVGEATPYYLFSPDASERAARLVPEARLVVLLRDPVSRAYSHYKHNVRRGHETRLFPEVVSCDLERYASSGDLFKHPEESEYEFRHHSYVRRGLYHEQLKRWMSYFPRERFFVGRAEDFFTDPAKVTSQVVEFLGLRSMSLPTGKAHNQYAYERKDRDEFPELIEFYEEPNRRLADLTGITW